MSYKYKKFQLVKDTIRVVDKFAEFVGNFGVNQMEVYTKSLNKKSEILHTLRMNNIVYIAFYSKDLIKISIKL